METRRPDLWNKFLYGNSGDAIEAASILYKLGEMSESVFKTVFLAICYTGKQKKAAQKKKKGGN